MSILDNQTRLNVGTYFPALSGGGGGGGGGANPTFSTIVVEGPSFFSPGGPGTSTTTNFVVSSIGGGGVTILTSPSTLGVIEQLRQVDANGVVQYIGQISLDPVPREMRINYVDNTSGDPGVNKATITLVSSISGGAGGIQLIDQGGIDVVTIANGDISLKSGNARVIGSVGTLPQATYIPAAVPFVNVSPDGTPAPLFQFSTLQGRTYRGTYNASMYTPANAGTSWLGFYSDIGLPESYFQYANNSFLSSAVRGAASPPAQSLTALYIAPSSYATVSALTSVGASTLEVSQVGLLLELVD